MGLLVGNGLWGVAVGVWLGILKATGRGGEGGVILPALRVVVRMPSLKYYWQVFTAICVMGLGRPSCGENYVGLMRHRAGCEGRMYRCEGYRRVEWGRAEGEGGIICDFRVSVS